jgi:hypothetical protein
MAEERPREQPGGKKPYSKPELALYGGLTQITQGIAGMTGDDGATMGPSKTA